MPKITVVADAQLVGALMEDSDFPVTDRSRQAGTLTESDRLGFELGSVETLLATFVAGVELIVIARQLLKAAKSSKNPKLEIMTPTARVSLDLTGKTEEEVAALVKAAMPFAR